MRGETVLMVAFILIWWATAVALGYALVGILGALWLLLNRALGG